MATVFRIVRRVGAIAAVAAALQLLPAIVVGPAAAQTPVQAQTAVKAQDHRLLAAGAGAILGNLFFNMAGMAADYPAGLPFITAVRASVPLDLVYGSRILLTASIGAGALVAHYLYTMAN